MTTMRELPDRGLYDPADEGRISDIHTVFRRDIYEGYIIQPYWRSLFNHAKEGVTIELHPSFEHHHYKWSVA